MILNYFHLYNKRWLHFTYLFWLKIYFHASRNEPQKNAAKFFLLRKKNDFLMSWGFKRFSFFHFSRLYANVLTHTKPITIFQILIFPESCICYSCNSNLIKTFTVVIIFCMNFENSVTILIVFRTWFSQLLGLILKSSILRWLKQTFDK